MRFLKVNKEDCLPVKVEEPILFSEETLLLIEMLLIIHTL
jgi:hypothetical protein